MNSAIKNLYAVIDTATGIYDGPFPLESDAIAIRGFSDQVANAESTIGKHPKDFAIVKVGTWNVATGEVKDMQNTTVITGLEAVAEMRKEVNPVPENLLKEVN